MQTFYKVTSFEPSESGTITRTVWAQTPAQVEFLYTVALTRNPRVSFVAVDITSMKSLSQYSVSRDLNGNPKRYQGYSVPRGYRPDSLFEDFMTSHLYSPAYYRLPC